MSINITRIASETNLGEDDSLEMLVNQIFFKKINVIFHLETGSTANGNMNIQQVLRLKLKGLS